MEEKDTMMTEEGKAEETASENEKEELLRTGYCVSTKTTAKDLFKFQIYYTYFGLTGMLLIFLAVLALGDLIVNRGTMNGTTIALAVVIIGWVLVGNPILLYKKSQKQAQQTQLFQNPVDVIISSKGLGLYQGEEGGVVDWKEVTKIVIWCDLCMFFMGKVRAHLVSLDQIPEQREDFIEAIRKAAPNTRLVNKRSLFKK